MGHLKGHVSVKSNAFSPTCKRLTSQDMVLDNMMAHTKKVNAAKSRIDNSLPKSWTSSIVKRDQIRRQAIARGATPSSSRPSSASKQRSSSSAPVTPAKLDYHLDGSLCSEDMEILSDIYGDDRISQYNTPRSLQSIGRRRPTSQMNGRTSQVIQTTIRNPSHDLLDTRASKFTEGGRSHTPRTLKTTAKSRLAQSKYYNPPKRKGRSDVGAQWEEKDAEHVNGENLNETRDMRSTRHDRHESVEEESKRNEDHIRWMEEQAERVNQLRLDDTYQSMNGETMDASLPIYSARLETMSYRSRSQNEKRMREEEEELKYLEFVTDVTNDVLNRGIFTNTVLKQVFDAHIERNKDRLDEERMRKLMKQLQQDLAIPDES